MGSSILFLDSNQRTEVAAINSTNWATAALHSNCQRNNQALTRVLDELDSNHGGHVSLGPAVPILFKEGKNVGTLKSTGPVKVRLACPTYNK